MTNTLPSRHSDRALQQRGGHHRHKRTVTDLGLALITPIVGSEFLDRHGLRGPLNRGLKYGVKQVFSTAGAATRQFKKVQGVTKPPARLKPGGSDYFDLTPDDDQKMIVDTVEQFAGEILRPAARGADDAAAYPSDLMARAAELGITAIKVPEDFDGIAEQRTTVTNALVARGTGLRRHGPGSADSGPRRVASALTHWGSADQQATYLADFAGDNVPQACLAIAEPQPLFDPTALKTTAVRTPSGYRIDGVKSLVPAAAEAELFVIAAQFNGKPTMFLVEADTPG